MITHSIGVQEEARLRLLLGWRSLSLPTPFVPLIYHLDAPPCGVQEEARLQLLLRHWPQAMETVEAALAGEDHGLCSDLDTVQRQC